MSRAIHRPSPSPATATAQPARGQALGHRFSVSGPAPTHCSICPDCGPTWAPKRDAAPLQEAGGAARTLRGVHCTPARHPAPCSLRARRPGAVAHAAGDWRPDAQGCLGRLALRCPPVLLFRTYRPKRGRAQREWHHGWWGLGWQLWRSLRIRRGSGCLGWNLPQPAWQRTLLPDLSQTGQVAAPALNS